MSQSLVNEGRFPQLICNLARRLRKEARKSQSLVNEGRFPQLCVESKQLEERGRNPSLMRAGFHIFRRNPGWILWIHKVAIPR